MEPEWNEDVCLYHLINKSPIKFIRWVERDLMDSHNQAEIRSLRYFKTRAKDLVKRIIAMVTWAQLANVHGFGSMYLRMPGVLESRPYPPRSRRPSTEAISRSWGDYQGDVRYLFRYFWLYLMALLQYWEEAAEGIGPFGGPCRPDSAPMLFVFSRINHLLETEREITRVEVRSFTDWDRYAREELSAEERSVMREEYCHNKVNQKRLWWDICVAYT